MPAIHDYQPLLKQAITEAKEMGLAKEAKALEQRCFIASTTSSEILGEHNSAIRCFLAETGRALPADTRKKIGNLPE